MLNKLIEGRYLATPAFDNSSGVAPGPDFPAHFELVTGREYNVAESTGKWNPFSRTTSAVTAGGHATKAHRTFRWLPWLKGKVSIAPLIGSDVLTGPFSGCWLPVFTFGGVQYVGHIGTFDSEDTTESVQAKAAWTALRRLPGFSLQAAYHPLRQAPQAWIDAALRRGVTMDILAAVSTGPVCQLVGVSPDLKAGPGEKAIVGSLAAQNIVGTMTF